MGNENVGHPCATQITPRQRAFAKQFYRDYGDQNFSLDQIFEKEFDQDIAEAFGLSRLGNGKLPRQDDLTALTKHLGAGGYLEPLNGCRSFRLTDAGIELATDKVD